MNKITPEYVNSCITEYIQKMSSPVNTPIASNKKWKYFTQEPLVRLSSKKTDTSKKIIMND